MAVMKCLLVCLVGVVASDLATKHTAVLNQLAEENNVDVDSFLELSTQQNGNLLRCRSRRGVGEVKSIGRDCHESASDDGLIHVTFPMKQVAIEFPCIENFNSVPLVVATVHGPNANKLYATSVRNVTATSFSVNVQRVDDVDNPDMSCHEIFIAYLAVVLG